MESTTEIKTDLSKYICTFCHCGHDGFSLSREIAQAWNGIFFTTKCENCQRETKITIRHANLLIAQLHLMV